MCLERLGKLEIPNGLAGAAGPAGANGAGWASGGGPPSGQPTSDVLFYLDINSGALFKWNSSTLGWDTIVASIFGTDGSQWITGTGIPTSTSYPAGTLYLDVGSSSPTKGNIYEYDGVSWGASTGNIKGQDGTNGVNGTGLLGSSVNVSTQTFTTPSSFNLNNTVAFNGLIAFPTIGSVVKSTIFLKARYSTGISANAPTDAAIYYTPRLINSNSTAYSDLNTPSIDQNGSAIDFKILYGPSAINNNYTHGKLADPSTYGVSNSGLPYTGTSPGQLAFPYAYTKIVTTLVRVNSSNVVGSVEYTTTTRYGSYTAVYQPTLSSLTLGFGSGDGISIELLGSVDVSSPNFPIIITPIYHIVEKSIL